MEDTTLAENKIKRSYLVSRIGVFAGIFLNLFLTLLSGLSVVFLILISLGLILSGNYLFIISLVLLSVLLFATGFLIFSRRGQFNRSQPWRLVERASSIPDGRLEGIYQLYRERSEGEDTSGGLVKRALKNIQSRVKTVFPVKEQLRRYHLLLLLPLMIIAFLFLFKGELISTTVKMIVEPVFGARDTEFSIVIEPEGAKIYKGSDLDISVGIEGAYVTPRLELTADGESEFIEGKPVKIGEYLFHLEDVEKDSHYRAIASGKETETFLIDTVERLNVLSKEMMLRQPDYARLPTTRSKEFVSQSVLPGTELTLDIVVSGDIRDIYLMTEAGRYDLRSEEGGHFILSTSVYSPASLSLHATDEMGKSYNFGTLADLQIMEDEYPDIELLIPSVDVSLSKTLKLPMKVGISDDYGVSNITLEYENLTLGESGMLSVMELPEHPTEGVVDFTFDFHRCDPLPGDFLKVWAVCYDNDTVGGPKSSRSQPIVVVIPDIGELFTFEYDKTRESGITSHEVSELGKSIEETLSDLSKEIEEKEGLDYSSYRELEDIMEREKELTESAEELKEQIEEMLKNSEESYLSLETVHKLSELNEKLDEVFGEEMREMMENLQKAMESVSTEEMSEYLDEAIENQKHLDEELDRILSLLERIKEEAQLDSIMERSDRLVEKQKELLEMCEDREASELLSEEQKVEGGLEGLLSEMSEYREGLDEEGGEIYDENISEELRKKLREQMSETLRELQETAGEGKRSELSLQSLEEMLSQLKKLRSSLGNFQEQYYSMETEKLIGQMEDALCEMGEMMSLLEMMKGMSDDEELQSEMSDEMSGGLGGLREKLSELSGETLFMGSGPGELLSQAEEEMSAMGEGEGDAGQHISEAQGDLAKAMAMVEMARQGLMSASTPSGLQDMLSALQKIGEGQKSLGNSLMDMLLGNQGKLTREQLARLSAQQQALRQALSQLMQKYRGIEELTEDLTGAMEAMEKIENMLSEGVEGERIKEEQEHLMERLLRATHALKTKGISRERKSEPGEFYPNPQLPKHLPPGVDTIPHTSPDDVGTGFNYDNSLDYAPYVREYMKFLVE